MSKKFNLEENMGDEEYKKTYAEALKKKF